MDLPVDLEEDHGLPSPSFHDPHEDSRQAELVGREGRFRTQGPLRSERLDDFADPLSAKALLFSGCRGAGGGGMGIDGANPRAGVGGRGGKGPREGSCDGLGGPVTGVGETTATGARGVIEFSLTVYAAALLTGIVTGGGEAYPGAPALTA